MIYPVNDEYQIRTDPLNFILERLSPQINRQTGEETQVWKVVGYHPTLRRALQAIGEDYLLDQQTQTVLDLINRLNSLCVELHDKTFS